MSVPGDVARASVLVRVPRDAAFRIFTEEIDAWWRRGPAYRNARTQTGVMYIEPFVGGRLFESFDEASGPRTVETGRVTTWDPPRRLVLTWRGVNFSGDEKTEVEVAFEERASGTMVTVTHSGWSTLRPDHPVRHGQDVAPFIGMIGGWWGTLLSSLREHAVRDVTP